MNTKSKIYSLEYIENGKKFALQLVGTKEEAMKHSMNLGLGAPEEVIALIPDLAWELN